LDICYFDGVDDKKTKKRLDDATLSAVTEEMAKPRLAASVRRIIGKETMNAHAKFNIGALLHNRNTNEDGLVKRVYEVGGAVMYEVLVPASPITYNISDWGEAPLEASGRPPRDWSYQHFRSASNQADGNKAQSLRGRVLLFRRAGPLDIGPSTD
jgi:hypothetical protein